MKLENKIDRIHALNGNQEIAEALKYRQTIDAMARLIKSV